MLYGVQKHIGKHFQFAEKCKRTRKHTQ